MVTLKYYLDTFSAVMPKRIEIIQNVLRRKKILDYSLMNKKSINVATIAELQKIIGENTLFKKPESDDSSQTLRHYIWKAQKSIGLLEENLFSYFESLDIKIVEELESAGIPLRDTALNITRNSKDVVEIYLALDGAFIHEVECLNKMLPAFEKMSSKEGDKTSKDDAEKIFFENLHEYILAVTNEERFTNKITTMMEIHVKRTENLVNSVNNYIQKRDLNGRKDALGYVTDFLVMVGGIAFFISFGASVYQSVKEGQPIRPDTITLTIAVIEATMLIAQRIVLGSIQSTPSKKMLSLLQKINWLA
jgi:hypothetical protein